MLAIKAHFYKLNVVSVSSPLIQTNMADLLAGCCGGKDPDLKEPRNRSQLIDRQLCKDKSRLRRTIKILLLGPGESGKSTFIKQMRIINGREFQSDEIKMYKGIIYENVIKGMKVLIDAREKLQLTFGCPDSPTHATFIFNHDTNINIDEHVFVKYVPSVSELWKDHGIQKAFERRKEFHLVTSASLYSCSTVSLKET